MRRTCRLILQGPSLQATVQEHQAFQRISARTTECHQRGPCSATISGIGSSQEPTPKGSIAVDAEAVAGADASRRDASGQADPKAGSAAHRTTLPRNRHFQRIMRTNLASEGAAAEMLGRRSKWAGTRPDLEYYKEVEAEGLRRLRQLAPAYRARPSLASPLLGAAGRSLGALAGVLPRRYGDALMVGVADALREQYNDQLRELRASGLADEREAGPLRDALRALRDQPRPADGAVEVPDLAAMQRLQELRLEEGLAGVVKAGFKGLSMLCARV